MKKIRLLFCFSLFIFSFSLSFGQSWLWGAAGYGSIKTDDFGSPVAADKQGNAYITGQYSINIVFGNDTLSSPHAESPFLVKFDSNGMVKWATQPNTECDGGYGLSVATDPNSNIFITGNFTYGNIIFGNDTLSNSIYNDIFLVKYNSSGTVLWAKQSTLNGGSLSNSVATDNSGNVYITGYFSDSVTFGDDTLRYPNSNNAFIAKYDNNGNFQWARQSTGTGYCQGNSISARNGYEYVTGYFKYNVTFGTYHLTTTTGWSVFVVKYDSIGNVVWCKQSTGKSNFNEGMAITSDLFNNIYIGGCLYDTLIFGSDTLIGPTARLTPAAFLVKYNSNGILQWAKESTGGGWNGTSLSIDRYNRIYYGGYGLLDTLEWGSLIITTSSPNSRSSDAAFILILDTAGNSLCGSILANGSSFGQSGYSVNVASDISGTYIYEAGLLEDDTLDCGPDTIATESTIYAPYIARWQPCDIETSVNKLPPQCVSSLLFPDPNIGIFTIQLSDVNSNSEIEIYNILGEMVYTSTLPPMGGGASSAFHVNLSSESTGMYLYRIISETGQLIGDGKFIIEN